MYPKDSPLYFTLLTSGTVLLMLMTILVVTIIRYHRKSISIRKELEGRDMNILEHERKRLTYDLHDAVAPLMTAIHIRLNLLEPDNKLNVALVAEVKELLQQTVDCIKEVSANLVPKSLQAEGLSVALRDLTIMMSASNKIPIRYSENTQIPRLVTEREVHVYRMAEEILNNAGRHSKGNEIILDVKCTEDRILITVKDNGIGFNPASLSKENMGWGLRHIISRAEFLKGEIFLESNARLGTNYLINIPV